MDGNTDCQFLAHNARYHPTERNGSLFVVVLGLRKAMPPETRRDNQRTVQNKAMALDFGWSGNRTSEDEPVVKGHLRRYGPYRD